MAVDRYCPTTYLFWVDLFVILIQTYSTSHFLIVFLREMSVLKLLPVFRCYTACLMARLLKLSHSFKMNHGPAKTLRMDLKLSPSVTAVWKAAGTDLPLQLCCWCQGQIYRNGVCVGMKHQLANTEITLWFHCACSEALLYELKW